MSNKIARVRTSSRIMVYGAEAIPRNTTLTLDQAGAMVLGVLRDKGVVRFDGDAVIPKQWINLTGMRAVLNARQPYSKAEAIRRIAQAMISQRLVMVCGYAEDEAAPKPAPMPKLNLDRDPFLPPEEDAPEPEEPVSVPPDAETEAEDAGAIEAAAPETATNPPPEGEAAKPAQTKKRRKKG